MNQPVVITVTQLNTYLKSILDYDENLSHVFLRGEISNFTNHVRSGHYYFSLKDEESVIKAVMFRSSNQRLKFRPENGMRVIVSGRVSVYERDGVYQLYAEDMQPDGTGALYLAYEQLKEKLEKEGLFSREKKRPIPRYPARIGVITSPTGAVIRDIYHVLSRRYPLAQVVFCPALVQGMGAPPQLIDALERMNRAKAADVIIIGRGGGSLEELWAFNDEKLVRAVAGSGIPVISAVGHETDVTLCDFAADLRAPTPSAAAELAVPDRNEIRVFLSSSVGSMRRSIVYRLQGYREALARMQGRPCLRTPENLIADKKVRLDFITSRMTQAFRHTLLEERKNLAGLAGKLQTLSPLSVLERGYAVAYRQGVVLSSVKQMRVNEQFELQLSDGIVQAKVTKIEEREEQTGRR